MKRAVVIGLLIAAAFGQASQASERFDRSDECRYATSDGRRGWSTEDVRRTIVCAVGKWSVPGGVQRAISVASCESGSDLLDRSTDGYAGTFQQAVRYWPGRRATFNPDAWDKALHRSVFNPRANVVVSIRMAHGVGWERDWSCA